MKDSCIKDRIQCMLISHEGVSSKKSKEVILYLVLLVCSLQKVFHSPTSLVDDNIEHFRSCNLILNWNGYFHHFSNRIR